MVRTTPVAVSAELRIAVISARGGGAGSGSDQGSFQWLAEMVSCAPRLATVAMGTGDGEGCGADRLAETGRDRGRQRTLVQDRDAGCGGEADVGYTVGDDLRGQAGH